MTKIFSFILLCFIALSPLAVFAQESQALSVTPPLFQVDLQPGDAWKSYIKVINTNKYPLSVYTTPVNFEPVGEDGQGKFLPLVDSPAEDNSLATWLDISKTVTVIAPEQSTDIPFTIAVPHNASPGGHFAAVLVGTKPPDRDGKVSLETSQVVTSLFLVRIAGDVVEKGSIREFSTTHSFYNTPEAEFTLRFQNEGTVHLQPQGDITIYNMWGKERGFIPINQKTHFGNVLPNSIRKFTFDWSGESSLTDIGRYKAVATLTYGTSGRQSDFSTVYFWVIPVKATLITLAFIAGFVLFIMYAVKMYIRRVVALAGYEPMRASPQFEKRHTKEKKSIRITRRELVLPLKKGVVDLRSTLTLDESPESRFKHLWVFIKNYRVFLIATGIGIVALIVIGVYFRNVLTASRAYEVTVKQPDGSLTISSEEVLHDRLRAKEAPKTAAEKTSASQTKTLIRIVNASGEAGVGARIALSLEDHGYKVDGIANDTDVRAHSVVVYEQAQLESASALAKLIPGALLSSFVPDQASSSTSLPLTLFLGADAR